MTTWYPIGPDFVYKTRYSLPPKRVSSRNEYARQAMVKSLAVDPINPAVLYTVERPYPQAGDSRSPDKPFWPPGASAFRRAADGRSWTAIADSLIQADPMLVPTCVAVHPIQTNNVYLGTRSGQVHASTTSGDTWASVQNLGAEITQIVVDPRGATNPATTTLYAGTVNGLKRSIDGGGSWQPLPVAGQITCLSFHMPTAGTAHLYVGVYQMGVYHATDPAGPWTLLNGGPSGLPAHSAFLFDGVLIDYARLNPSRVYVWLARITGQSHLYRTDAGPSGFVDITSATLPPADLTRFAFAVAPNSPGTGLTDVLLITEVWLHRSTDSGQSWQTCADIYHADHHCIGFSTMSPGPGMIPVTYLGCDGGAVALTRLADATFNITTPPSDYSDGAAYSASGVAQNLNQGKLSVAVIAYATDAASAAVGYIGCQDTGLAAHGGVLGWRGLDNSSDVWGVATAPGIDGLKVWYTSPFDIRLATDHGEDYPPFVLVSPGAPNSGMSGSSNLAVDAGRRCLSGVFATTQLQNPVNAGANQVATPYSMLGVGNGALVMVENEIVNVAGTTATTFTATFASPHLAGSAVKVFFGVVVRIDQTGLATQVSQVFGVDFPKVVAASPTDDTLVACITGQQSFPVEKVFKTSGVALGPTTVWSEVTTNKPGQVKLSAAAIDGTGKIYVLLTDLTATAPGGGPVTTPLYEVSTGTWVAQNGTGIPSGPFARIVARAGAPDTLYVAAGPGVYEVRRSGVTWTWTSIGGMLPGQAVSDLWIGNVGTVAAPKLLLRAAVGSRGIWETDVTSFAATAAPPTRPYFRHQAIDQGWLTPSLDGQVDPFAPALGPSLFHWESPDIKIDARRPAGGGALAAFYQNDPEYPLPVSHVTFDQLLDNSQNLPQSNDANIHVQVHNRSYTGLDNVNVWAIWCRPSGGVPSLAASPSMGNMFAFWSQFQANGTIVPGLPADSPWTSVGPPQPINSLDVTHPQVATFADWVVPALAPGDPGHYCMVAFVHSQLNPINEMSMVVDAIASSNPQVAQKNLHITTMAPMALKAKKAPGVPLGLREYIEFHNPSPKPQVADLLFDFRQVPETLRAWVLVSEAAHSSKGAIRGGSRRSLRWEGKTDPSLRGLKWLRAWADSFEDAAEREDDDPDDDRQLPRFGRTAYEVKASGLLEVKGLRLQPFGMCASIFAVAALRRLTPGTTYTFRVLCRVGERIVGGSTYLATVPESETPKKHLPVRAVPE